SPLSSATVTFKAETCLSSIMHAFTLHSLSYSHLQRWSRRSVYRWCSYQNTLRNSILVSQYSGSSNLISDIVAVSLPLHWKFFSASLLSRFPMFIHSIKIAFSKHPFVILVQQISKLLVASRHASATVYEYERESFSFANFRVKFIPPNRSLACVENLVEMDN